MLTFQLRMLDTLWQAEISSQNVRSSGRRKSFANVTRAWNVMQYLKDNWILKQGRPCVMFHISD